MSGTRRVKVRFIIGLVFAMLTAGYALQPVVVLTANGTPEVIEFSAQPGVVERGGQVTLNWQVRGVDTVTIQQRYGSYKQPPDNVYDDLPASGVLTIDLSDSPVPYIHNVSFWLLTPSESASAWIPGYTFLTSAGVKVHCPYDGFFFGDDPYYDFCPLAEAQTIEAVYQPFDGGFLLWRSDSQTIDVFRSLDSQPFEGSAKRFTIGAAPISTPSPTRTSEIPPDRYVPDRVFATFLNDNRLHGIIIGFGWPTAPGTTYRATVQDTYNDTFFSAVSYMSLPDGRVVRYLEDSYTSSWLCMTCQVQGTQVDNQTLFQRFERGFMVRNAKAHCVYAYSVQDQNIILGPTIPGPSSMYHYCIEFDTLPETPVGNPPPDGLATPTGPFGRVWGFYPSVRDSLGYAVDSEQHYVGKIHPIDTSFGGGPFEMPQVALPDGRVLYCGMRAATAGKCTIR